jgi:hypothetical protein
MEAKEERWFELSAKMEGIAFHLQWLTEIINKNRLHIINPTLWHYR